MSQEGSETGNVECDAPLSDKGPEQTSFIPQNTTENVHDIGKGDAVFTARSTVSNSPATGILSFETILGPLGSVPPKTRVKLLEAEIKRLQDLKQIVDEEGTSNKENNGDGPKKANFEDDDEWIKHVKCKPELKYVDWSDFKNGRYCDCLKFRKWAAESNAPINPPAIEVLAGSPRYYWEKQSESWERRERLSNIAHANLPTVEAQDGDEGRAPKLPREMPDRIRINSKPILSFLQGLDKNVSVNEPAVLLRPYKLLFCHQEAIKKHLKRLGEVYTPTTNPFPHETDSAQSDHIPTDIGTAQKKSASTEIFDSAMALEDFRCLQRFIEKELLPVDKAYRTNRPQMIRFRDLWHLYQPGDLVVGSVIEMEKSQEPNQAGDRLQEKWPVWRVVGSTGGRPFLGPSDDEKVNSGRPPAPDNRLSKFQLGVIRIDFDGTLFFPVERTVFIPVFLDDKEISSLQLVPLRLHKDQALIREELTMKGKRFLQYVGPKHCYYNGPTVAHYHNGLRGGPSSERVQHVAGPVIVDFKEASKDDPTWMLGKPIGQRFIAVMDLRETWEDYEYRAWRDEERTKLICKEDDGIVTDWTYDALRTSEFKDTDSFIKLYWKNRRGHEIGAQDLTEEDVMLLPKHVMAFVLQRREFARLQLDNLEDIKTDEGAWDDLRLRKGYKDLLISRLNSHFENKKSVGLGLDIVEGKGLGLTFLLHGAPGVGKTATVECLAAKLRRPLYSITCGDLGTDASSVSENLREIFSKAQKWDCVLLLDEADVFLANRDAKDIKRNAIVSVFLSALEYYNGVLFLTTNRVGVFDDAFRSRIHFPIHYKNLNQRQTTELWKVNMQRLKRGAINVEMDEDDLEDYCEELWDNENVRWNGRQIKNAFQSAVALAQEQHRVGGGNGAIFLKRSHFGQVVEAGKDFEKYLQGIHRLDEAGRAQIHQHRRDDWGQPGNDTRGNTSSGWAPSSGGFSLRPTPQQRLAAFNRSSDSQGGFSRQRREYSASLEPEEYGGAQEPFRSSASSASRSTPRRRRQQDDDEFE